MLWSNSIYKAEGFADLCSTLILVPCSLRWDKSFVSLSDRVVSKVFPPSLFPPNFLENFGKQTELNEYRVLPYLMEFLFREKNNYFSST